MRNGELAVDVVLVVSVLLLCLSAHADLPDPQLMRPVVLREGTDLSVFARSTTQKVLPDEDLAEVVDLLPAEGIELAAARGEREQVQLVLRPSEDSTDLLVHFGRLQGPATIPPEAWDWRRVAYTHVRLGSYHYGLRTSESGMLPDPLEPPAPFDAPAGINTTLLLTIEVPRDAPPGEYSGSIALEGDDLQSLDIPISLTVWDITMPEEHLLHNFSSTVARDETAFRTLRELDLNTLKYGAFGITIDVDDAGVMTLGFEEYDPAAEFLLDDLGFYTIGVPPTMPLTNRGPRDRYLSMDVAVGSDEFWPLFEQYMRGIGDHMRERGRADRVIWKIGDELPEEMFPLTAEMCRRAKEVWPELRILLTTNFMSDELAGPLDIWCPGWHLFAVRPDEAPEQWRRRQAEGMEMWAYMNSAYMLNASWNPGALRICPTALAKYGFTGALWWSLRSYGGGYGDEYEGEPDPWTEIRPLKSASRDKTYYDFGNGHMLYPPREHDPNWRSSLRWEAFRQGMDEYDLLMLLQDRTEAALEALGVAEDAAPDAGVAEWTAMLATGFRLQNYRADASWIHRFRQLLANEIEALGQEPRAIVWTEPQGALLSPRATIRPGVAGEVEGAIEQARVRGCCAPDATVTVDGVPVEVTVEGGHGAFRRDLALQPGRNLVEVVVKGEDGAESTFYRELLLTQE